MAPFLVDFDPIFCHAIFSGFSKDFPIKSLSDREYRDGPTHGDFEVQLMAILAHFGACRAIFSLIWRNTGYNCLQYAQNRLIATNCA